MRSDRTVRCCAANRRLQQPRTSRLAGQKEEFLRGDVNDDGNVSISDAYRLELWLFQGTDTPGCLKTADSNDESRIEQKPWKSHCGPTPRHGVDTDDNR